MARRITDISKDLSIVNKEFARIDQHETLLDQLTRRLGKLESHIAQVRDTRQIISTNNLVFTWTGATLTLSWPAGFVQDSSLHNWAVQAGSLVVAASTVYWLAWNPRQQHMAFAINLNTLMTGIVVGTPNAPAGNNLIVCSVKTGTAGQTGTAGGGGTEAGGVGPSGKQYVNF